MKNKMPAEKMPVGMSNALTPDSQIKRQEYRKQRKQKASLIISAFAVMLIVAAVLIFSFMSVGVVRSLTIEAGDDMVSAGDFFKKETRAFFVGEKLPDTSKPGKYDLTVRNGIMRHSVTLCVQDTQPPLAVPKHIRMKKGEKILSASSFVKNINDKTEVTAEFETPIDYNRLGDSDVTVILRDLGNNETRYETKLTVYPEEIIPEVTVEAGYSELSVRNFLEENAPEYDGDTIVSELGEDFIHKIGSSYIEIMYCSVVYTVKLTVEDTVSPVGYIANQVTYKGKPLEADSFISQVNDETPVKISYIKKPDFDSVGMSVVEILLKDSGNNETKYKALLTVQNDTGKPVIEAENRTVYVGDNIRFSEGVKAFDDCDGELCVKVNIGDFDKKTPGAYPITFSATDKAGNTAEKTVIFTLKTKFAYQYTREVMDALFGSVYSKLEINEAMSEKEKVKKIYDYVRENISYNGTSEKSDWEQEAYRGLRSKSGDSFTFYSISRKLLTMAGIENTPAERINSDSSHYWNMITVDGIKYHFDTCPHYKDFPIESYMLTDKEALEYSEKTGGYYTYK